MNDRRGGTSLDQPFLKLPIEFDADALQADVAALSASAWVAHPSGYPGNSAVRLITPNGQATDDIEGPMAPTPSLESCPAIQQVMATLGCTWGRSRLMGLGAGAEVPQHVDVQYYWRTHWRIHVPVITNDQVIFTCDNEQVHMRPGECWLFDSFRPHGVRNGGDETRVHLVLDTVGGGNLWPLIEAARSGEKSPSLQAAGPMAFERVNSPVVMSPWEMQCHQADIVAHARTHPKSGPVLATLDRLVAEWRALWAQHGERESGHRAYAALLAECRARLQGIAAAGFELDNGQPVLSTIDRIILQNALSPKIAQGLTTAAAPVSKPSRSDVDDVGFDRPILIMSTPRSGSTLLFETLRQAPGLFSTGQESHQLIEALPGLAPFQRGWSSNRLTEAEAKPQTVDSLNQAFAQCLSDRDGEMPSGTVRMLEKTPKNSLRAPFFAAAWPDARFVYLYRDVRETLGSMIEAWQSGRLRTYPNLPGWTGQPWSMLLIPGWEKLNGRPLAEVVAQQWATTTMTLLDDLEQLDERRVHCLAFAALVRDPQSSMVSLTSELGLQWDLKLGRNLPLSRTTLSPPSPDKWRAHEQEIERVMPIVEEANRRALDFLATRTRTRPQTEHA